MVASSSTTDRPAVSELQPAVKELCRTLDGFVYVVDATAAADHSPCLQFAISFYILFSVDLFLCLFTSAAT